MKTSTRVRLGAHDVGVPNVKQRTAALCLFLALTLHACTWPSTPKPVRAFYYWRTTLSVSQAERAALSELRVQKLYLRLFDVVLNDENAPITAGRLQTTDPSLAAQLPDLVPVVFLRNQVFERMPPEGAAHLATFVWNEVQATLPARSPTEPAVSRELQLDCDWTDTSQVRFFDFLRELRKLAPSSTQLSATIRLHQVKFRERTGIPPVDRGMLMFYNMGRFDSSATERAIFDADVAERYLERLDEYPLPLDVALPIWSWTLQVRDDRVVGLLQNTDPAELPSLDFLAARAEHRFEVSRTTFLRGQLLRQGDVLQGESLNAADLATAAQLLTRHLRNADEPRTVALFDLSEKNLKRHHPRMLEDTLAKVR